MFSSALSPRVVEDVVVEIEAGRHPVIALLLTEGEQYVANDTKMSVSSYCLTD